MKYILKPEDEWNTAVVQVSIEINDIWSILKYKIIFPQNIRVHLLELCAFSSEVET